MHRAHRAVIVGDPAQLEPTVTLPGTLIDHVLHAKKVPLFMGPHRTSLQGLADSVSRVGSIRLGQWIGCPLIVHQRCARTMFEIANVIAYGGAMVYGRTSGDVDQASRLAATAWLDTPHTATGHWNPDDWTAVRGVLDQVDWSDPPSIGVITPFRDVVAGLDGCVPDYRSKVLHPTAGRRPQDVLQYGTVHTFQGREVDVLFLVLGGHPKRPGAIHWATRTPNLMNVAVTRARDRLVWGDIGCAAVLAKLVPRA
jgi:superfamily I DNA and/or RNA helicase